VSAAAAVLAAILAAPGAAPVEGELVPQRVVTVAMAQCAVRRDPVAAEHFVLADLSDGDGAMPPPLKAARQRIIQALTPCVGHNFGSVTMPGIALRGFLAEALLTTNAGTALTAAGALPAVAAAPTAPGGHMGARFWRCVVAAAPRASADLIAAPDRSPEEGKAFDALLPSLQQCAPRDGALRIRPGNVRPQVAAALYVRLHASGGAMGGEG